MNRLGHRVGALRGWGPPRGDAAHGRCRPRLLPWTQGYRIPKKPVPVKVAFNCDSNQNGSVVEPGSAYALLKETGDLLSFTGSNEDQVAADRADCRSSLPDCFERVGCSARVHYLEP
jgi:hypothetical protein